MDNVWIEILYRADVAVKFAGAGTEGKAVVYHVVVLYVKGVAVSPFGKLEAGAFEAEELHDLFYLLGEDQLAAEGLLGYHQAVAVKALLVYGTDQAGHGALASDVGRHSVVYRLGYGSSASAGRRAAADAT